ncbi:methyltransferase type 11 [Steroidobacter denitrificans]|uniref:Methyltransferase type 11 n=1 Tax=Steroidobacter denitrificans TaxID=465721 RepID=A0A127FD35_STEDE|nr:class I SAM-dependent methyltransferase [Steroidobacter denitrificans]AMN47590.1 methyltransferase type 11 [Steroidobacter denitrificans]
MTTTDPRSATGIHGIDFAHLYREHLAAASRLPKPASAWDARADGISRRSMQSRYAQEFIGRMDLSGCSTLLDVGCGPGTISLPLAARLGTIYGLDYSQGMLDALIANADLLGVDNVQPILRAWEDDWSDIPSCDIVVASRSTSVQDMAAALEKLNDKANKRVYLTHTVGGKFVSQEILEVIGRKRIAAPDYIYVVNILHAMGIHPRVDYIRNDANLDAGDFDDLLKRVSWSLGRLNENETARLRRWSERTGANPVRAPMQWAFISWDKQPD